jgi:hypothetical protein
MMDTTPGGANSTALALVLDTTPCDANSTALGLELDTTLAAQIQQL